MTKLSLYLLSLACYCSTVFASNLIAYKISTRDFQDIVPTKDRVEKIFSITLATTDNIETLVRDTKDKVLTRFKKQCLTANNEEISSFNIFKHFHSNYASCRNFGSSKKDQADMRHRLLKVLELATDDREISVGLGYTHESPGTTLFVVLPTETVLGKTVPIFDPKRRCVFTSSDKKELSPRLMESMVPRRTEELLNVALDEEVMQTKGSKFVVPSVKVISQYVDAMNNAIAPSSPPKGTAPPTAAAPPPTNSKNSTKPVVPDDQQSNTTVPNPPSPTSAAASFIRVELVSMILMPMAFICLFV